MPAPHTLKLSLSICLCLFLAGCGSTQIAPPLPSPGITVPPTATVASDPTGTIMPSLAVRMTRTPGSQSSAAPAHSATPIPVGTLDTLRQTPPTLMLHMRSPQFDSVAFLRGFVKILKAKGYRVVTYQEISGSPDITAAEQGRLFILTIDDISLQAEIDPSILEMIEILRDAKYPAVLGIVTTGTVPNENTTRRLRDLANEGWELAMHTDTHTNLQELEQISSYGARLEIRTCAEKIFNSTGISPITLVLPYGAMVTNLKILYREKVVWTVGINGGERYRTTNYTYYVGREGPDGDPQATFDVMMKRFNQPVPTQ